MLRIGRPGLLGMAARTAVVAGTATAVSGSVSRHQQQKAEDKAQQQAAQAAAAAPPPQATPAAPAAAAPGGEDMMTKLTQLAQLHSQGILTDEEFATAKAKLLA